MNGQIFFPHQFLKILRCSNGFGEGTSIIKENPLALAIFYNTMRFENATIRKGGNKKGYILAKNKLTKEAIKGLKDAWQNLYTNNYDAKDNAVVLNEGVDFKESSATSVELQLNENKQTNAAEICKLFCMPIDVLNGKAAQETLSQFVQNCLMPPINTIEAALDHDLLTEAEKSAHYYFAFDTSELTRGDFATRINAYAVALQNNIYQLDEIREMEDKPPLNFNYIRLSLADVLLDPRSGKIYTPNTDKMALMDVNSGLTAGEKDDTIEKRHNPYHDPSNGRFTSGGINGGGLTDKMLTKEANRNATAIENKRLLKEKIASGELLLSINPEKQVRHILPEGASVMPDGRSFVTIDETTQQDIVNRYATTGDVTYTVSNQKFTEFIETDTIVGVDGRSNEKTNQAFIFYSKTGTHLTPTKKGRDKK